jgi:tetratricopeptide (TPR) repeat protein
MTNNHLLIYRLAELMLKKQQHILALDDLFEDEQIGAFVRSIQIDSPYQQLIFEGVLTETITEERIMVTFTVEGYFHYVLGEVIEKQTLDKGPVALKELLENNKLRGITEGVEQCLVRDVEKNDLSRLIWLIDEGGKALETTSYPLAQAFLKMDSETVISNLLENPTANDWQVIRNARSILFKGQKNETISKIDGLIAQSKKLKEQIETLLKSNNENDYIKSIELIGIYSDINALDEAKSAYTSLIEKLVDSDYKEPLANAYELLGESEYKRAGQAGYKLAMETLTKALEIRESEEYFDRKKLTKTYRLLGFTYLSLGLQVIKSNEFLNKSKKIILEENSENIMLAEINLYLGLTSFWRGLKGIGRWGDADPKILIGVKKDLFDQAEEHFKESHAYFDKFLGKSHPDTLKSIHYLQENFYALGRYEKAIPWLKKYVKVIPFIDKKYTNNYYFYSLIVALEEYVKELVNKDKELSKKNIEEALHYAEKYHNEKDHEITLRLKKLRSTIDTNKIITELKIPQINSLPIMAKETKTEAKWSKLINDNKIKGYQTNPWMIDGVSILFFNNEKKSIIKWQTVQNKFAEYKPEKWPEGCGRMIFNENEKRFYMWSSIKSNVFVLNDLNSKWEKIFSGFHDVHACGASFGYNPFNNQVFEFGGYGYFTYKNWMLEFSQNKMKWDEVIENKPGISPYPRNGSLFPIENGNKVVLISGIGSDTGIQREHKARFGLPSATDVGYFTWLRDAFEIDLETMKWKNILPANHHSIRHNGAKGYNSKLGVFVNWGGSIPPSKHGEKTDEINMLSTWNYPSSTGFKETVFEGNLPPLSGGNFVEIPNSNNLLFMHSEGCWKLSLITNDQ